MPFGLLNGVRLGRTSKISSITTLRMMCTNNNEEAGNKNKTSKKDDKNGLPEAPTTCCMSGCPNCVWLDYAEKLSEYFKDGGKRAMEELNEKVSDENIKAFIMHEWRMRQKE